MRDLKNQHNPPIFMTFIFHIAWSEIQKEKKFTFLVFNRPFYTIRPLHFLLVHKLYFVILTYLININPKNKKEIAAISSLVNKKLSQSQPIEGKNLIEFIIYFNMILDSPPDTAFLRSNLSVEI